MWQEPVVTASPCASLPVSRPPKRLDPTVGGWMSSLSSRRRFTLILIKPSHYDDDGYVIQWLRSAIPSNTLAALYGLAVDSAERHILGPDVDIEITAYDETNTRIRPERIAKKIARADQGMVGLV